VCAIPLLTVLAHTHSSSVARGRVAAGALTDLEADATAGAAGRPGGPRSPRAVSMETHRATSVSATLATDAVVMAAGKTRLRQEDINRDIQHTEQICATDFIQLYFSVSVYIYIYIYIKYIFFLFFFHC